MFFGIFIFSRLLFIASIVLVMGYVFGRFSQNRTLTTLAKIASVLLIVLFIGSNAFFFRGRAYARAYDHRACPARQTDSAGKH